MDARHVEPVDAREPGAAARVGQAVGRRREAHGLLRRRRRGERDEGDQACCRAPDRIRADANGGLTQGPHPCGVNLLAAVEWIGNLDRSVSRRRRLSWCSTAVAVMVVLVPGAFAQAPNDARQGEQWAVADGAVLNLPGAWELSQGAGVTVAVIDSGARLDHPDLAPNVWVNFDEVPGNRVDDDANGYVDDVHGVDLTTSARGQPGPVRRQRARHARVRDHRRRRERPRRGRRRVPGAADDRQGARRARSGHHGRGRRGHPLRRRQRRADHQPEPGRADARSAARRGREGGGGRQRPARLLGRQPGEQRRQRAELPGVAGRAQPDRRRGHRAAERPQPRVVLELRPQHDRARRARRRRAVERQRRRLRAQERDVDGGAARRRRRGADGRDAARPVGLRAARAAAAERRARLAAGRRRLPRCAQLGRQGRERVHATGSDSRRWCGVLRRASARARRPWCRWRRSATRARSRDTALNSTAAARRSSQRAARRSRSACAAVRAASARRRARRGRQGGRLRRAAGPGGCARASAASAAAPASAPGG